MTMTSIDTKTMTRDAYVAFRPKWRADYKALSAEILATKHLIKSQMKANLSTGNLQNDIRVSKFLATVMLDNLRDAKARLKELADEVSHAA